MDPEKWKGFEKWEDEWAPRLFIRELGMSVSSSQPLRESQGSVCLTWLKISRILSSDTEKGNPPHKSKRCYWLFSKIVSSTWLIWGVFLCVLWRGAEACPLSVAGTRLCIWACCMTRLCSTDQQRHGARQTAVWLLFHVTLLKSQNEYFSQSQ